MAQRLRSYMLQVLVENRKGVDMDDAARRLAKRLEAIGLTGVIEGGAEHDVDEEFCGLHNVEFGRKEV